jgi:hypothetical protein
MDRNVINKIALVGAGLCIGGGTGYIIARKQLEAKYEALFQEEVDSVHKMAQRFTDRIKEHNTPSELAEKLHPEEYDTDTEVIVDGEHTEINIFRNEPPLPEADPENPYIISLEEFMADEFNHEQGVLTWFAGDETLMDEKEEIIPDVESVVGVDNLAHFGWASRDENVLYVRNQRLSLDLEITRNPGKYSVTVMGADPDDGRDG